MDVHVQYSAQHTYQISLAYTNTPQSSHCHALGKTTDKHSTLIEVETREGKNLMRAL